MHQLTFELRNLTLRNQDGAYATRANRVAMLKMFGEQLWEAGYKHLHVGDLKGRHVNALLRRWQADGVSDTTIRNRLSTLRWWAEKIGRASVLAPTNAPYGLAPRVRVARTSQAVEVPTDRLAHVRCRYVRMSLELQRAFGLRREESIKIKPGQADRGDRLVLQGSWTKGGRSREIPIRTLAQRDVLDRAKALARRGALIPASRSYKQQLHRYEHFTRQAGLHRLHGLRHAYACARFQELAGFPCPAAGGPHRAMLTPDQRAADYEARVMLSAEMGHVREAITAAYLGR